MSEAIDEWIAHYTKEAERITNLPKEELDRMSIIERMRPYIKLYVLINKEQCHLKET